MRRWTVVVVLVLALVLGCAMVQKESCDTFVVAEAPPVAFPLAVHATLAVGATITDKDSALGMISAMVNQGGSLKVIVRPYGQGSEIEVVNTRASNYLGTITTAEQWRTAYGQSAFRSPGR